MSIIYVLIPLAIVIVGIAVVIFFWAVRSNQFDDLDRQGYSILFDDDIKQKDIDTNEQKEKINKTDETK
jgi:cbb3-type cytochrome oxidase maturation protein